MDRRSLLALAATIPALAAAQATACSIALKSPRSAGLTNQQVMRLFVAWWNRDKDEFSAIFTKTLMADGSIMDPKLARELQWSDPLPFDSFAIFDRFFTDERKVKKTSIIVNTDAGVFVACSEADPATSIQPDCGGMPKQHLFLVTMRGLNARRVTHLASTETAEPGKFSIWTEGFA